MTTEIDAPPDSLLDRTNRRLAMSQRTITWDDYWVRFVDVANRLVTFGHVLSLEAMKDAVVDRHYEPMIAMHGDGYVLSETYVVGADMTITSPHRSALWPISQRLFEDAKSAGWAMEDLSQAGKFALIDAWQGFSEHSGYLARLR